MCGRIEVLENEKNKEKKKKRRRRRGRRCVKFISSAEQSSFTYKLIRRSVEWQIEHRNGCDVRETSTRRHPVCQTDNELSTHRSPGWPINTKVNIRTNLHQIQWTCSWCNLSSYITLVNGTLLHLLQAYLNMKPTFSQSQTWTNLSRRVSLHWRMQRKSLNGKYHLHRSVLATNATVSCNNVH